MNPMTSFRLFVASLLFFFCGLFFFAYRNCEWVPTEVLTVGLVDGLPLGSSGDSHHGFNWDVASFLAQKLNKQLERKSY